MGRFSLKDEASLSGLRAAGRLVADAFVMLAPHIKPGVKLLDLDALVEAFVRSRGATPAYKGYQPDFSQTPFPGTICTAVNDEVCHGIPSARKLRSGDIVGVDVGVFLDGWAGDACFTFCVGDVSAEARKLVDVTRAGLDAAIAVVKPGARLGDIGAAIQRHVEAEGFSVVRELGGHGLGKVIHEAPHVNHFGQPGTGMRLDVGMVFTIEPMINAGGSAVRQLDDHWTVVTADRKRSAQFEHTVLVTDTGAEILTPWHQTL
jgi:methionyl aminopeptidase